MKRIAMMLLMAMVAISTSAADYLKVKPNYAPDAQKYRLAELDYSQITALEVTATGRLWASMLGGGDSADGFLTLAYSDSKGTSWIENVLALDARAERLAVRNGVLWLSPKGELWLFYTVFDGYFDGRGSMWAISCKNPNDEKPIWGEPQYIGVGVATGRPLVNDKGEWILPTALWGRRVMGYTHTRYISNEWRTPRFASPYIDKYIDLDEKRGAGVYVSADEGASWHDKQGVVKCKDEAVKARYNNPQLFRHSDGSLRMVLRTSGTAWSYVSASKDGAEWSEPARFVAAPDQNFAVHRLSDGKLLMVRNARFDRRLFWQPEGMYVYLSEDCGATWYGGLRLANDLLTINPVVAEAKDGMIYIATHSDPEVERVNRLFTTSVAEIDAANADAENTPSNSRVIFTAGKAAERAKAETAVLTAPRSDWAEREIRIATYNIQYPIENWPVRCVEGVVPLIDEYKFDVFGVQEPYMPQIEDMMKHLGDDYAWVGENVTGDNSDRTHHFNPVFYRKERVEMLDFDSVWFSDAIGTPGYGARSSRMMTWVKFRDKLTGKIFFVFNGHYDHRGYEAKMNASYVVLDLVRHISQGLPAFVTADYNSDEKSKPYAILQESPLLEDTMLAVENPVNAQYQSHAGYKPVQNKPANGMHIDHVFYTPNTVRINHWELIIKDYNGKWGSDHLPIFVDCLLAN